MVVTQKSAFQNPSKPHFNHYLFESLCLSIRITCKANPAAVGSFEDALFPVFTEILQNDVQGVSLLLLPNFDGSHPVQPVYGGVFWFLGQSFFHMCSR